MTSEPQTTDELPWWWHDNLSPREIFRHRLAEAWCQAPLDLDENEADLILADLERAGWRISR